MDSRTKAKNKYNKEKTKAYCLRLNLKTDKDIIEILDHANSKQGFIKALIRMYAKDSDLSGVDFLKKDLKGIDPGEVDICTLLGDTSICTLASGDCSKCIRSKVMKAAEKAESKPKKP